MAPRHPQDRFLIDFGSQLVTPERLGSILHPNLGQNPPKSLKNRCQDAFHLGLHFLIDFWSVLALNLDPFHPKKPYFSLGKTSFFEKSPFEVHIDF